MTEYQLTVERTGEIPFLLLSRAGLPPQAPLVLVLHGLGSFKEKVFPSLYAFAREGFRVAALDARLHGERPGADTREQRLAEAYLPTMYDLIAGTARDVTALLDHLGADRAAVHGISLGGYITFAALLSEPRLAVASVAMGSPDWLGPLRGMGLDLTHPGLAPIVRENPLDRAADAYPPRPVLVMHGLEDNVVPVAGVQALEQSLRPAYAASPDRLEVVLFPDLGHQYTDEMLERSLSWTRRFL